MVNYYSHKPRQLPGRGRRFAALKRHPRPQPNPSLAQMRAAQKIQRAFRKKRYVPKKPISVGTEIYQMRLGAQSSLLSQNTGSVVNGPANSLIMLPAGFSQHTTCVDSNGTNYSPSGSWIKPVYGYTTKLRVSFDQITNHSDNKAGLNLRIIHGFVKIPTSKAVSGSGWGSQALFETEVLKIIKENLYESNVVSDFLEYSQKNRNVHISGRFDVKPNRSNMIRVDSLVHTNTVPSTTDTISSATFPPPKCYTIKHALPPNKTRLAFAADHNFPLLENMYLPFVMASCAQLTSNSGSFKCEHSSRMYFTDN